MQRDANACRSTSKTIDNQWKRMQGESEESKLAYMVKFFYKKCIIQQKITTEESGRLKAQTQNDFEITTEIDNHKS